METSSPCTTRQIEPPCTTRQIEPIIRGTNRGVGHGLDFNCYIGRLSGKVVSGLMVKVGSFSVAIGAPVIHCRNKYLAFSGARERKAVGRGHIIL